jgi:hypothetical protein
MSGSDNPKHAESLRSTRNILLLGGLLLLLNLAGGLIFNDPPRISEWTLLLLVATIVMAIWCHISASTLERHAP